MNNKFLTTQIGVAHFNNETLQQNNDWKIKKHWKGSIYGFQRSLPKKIPYESYLYIIEMNNEKNEIAGIGFIKNEYHSEWRTMIYNKCHDYNRYILKSSYHRNRKYLLANNPKMILFLEKILFTGCGHLKRTNNFTLSLDKIASAPAYIIDKVSSGEFR